MLMTMAWFDNGVVCHGPWEDVKTVVRRAARALAEVLQEDMAVLSEDKTKRKRTTCA